MLLTEIHDTQPVIYSVIKGLLKRGKEVQMSVTRSGDPYDVVVDDVSWDPRWPDVLAVEYSIQKRNGDWLNGQEEGLSDVHELNVRDMGSYYWLHHDPVEPEPIGEELETIAIDIIEKLLNKGERIWVSRQGRSAAGILKGIRRSDFSFSDAPAQEMLELEVDVQAKWPKLFWTTNWWTIPVAEVNERLHLKQQHVEVPGREPADWKLTVRQRKA